MSKDGFERNGNLNEEKQSELDDWAALARLTKQDSIAIRNAVLNAGKHDDWWLERMSARIDRTVARTQRRIDQVLERIGTVG
jgi:hypothetical protein